MCSHVCPWWGGYFIDNRLRRLIHNPQRILSPYVRAGMRTMDFGCGMGMFAIGMAELVGDAGLVIAVDLQEQMLATLRRRAKRAGVECRIRTHRCRTDSIGLDETVDFTLASFSVHEVPDTERLIREIHDCLRPQGQFLIIEPIVHVSSKAFARTLEIAGATGLNVVERPRVRMCHAALLVRGEEPIA
jgi:ubiquinone/menaquinone biosynthesis C-methylase UbiE